MNETRQEAEKKKQEKGGTIATGSIKEEQQRYSGNVRDFWMSAERPSLSEGRVRRANASILLASSRRTFDASDHGMSIAGVIN